MRKRSRGSLVSSLSCRCFNRTSLSREMSKGCNFSTLLFSSSVCMFVYSNRFQLQEGVSLQTITELQIWFPCSRSSPVRRFIWILLLHTFINNKASYCSSLKISEKLHIPLVSRQTAAELEANNVGKGQKYLILDLFK